MNEPAARSPISFDADLLRRLGRLDLIGRLIADGVKQGLRRSRLHGFSTEFSDHTPYSPGDDLRFLDWRIYARTDRLLVRKYEAETSFESVLLLDASRSMAWRWESTVTKLEYGAQLLAALACLHIENQDAVGLLVHDAREIHHLPARSTRKHLGRICQVLSCLDPGAGSTFAPLVAALAPMKKHRGQIVICSDLEEDEGEIERSLEMLAARDDDLVILHLLDRAEIDPPFTGSTHLEDSETGEVYPVDVAELKREHGSAVRGFVERWRARCERWGIRYRSIDTGMPHVDAILGMAK